MTTIEKPTPKDQTREMPYICGDGLRAETLNVEGRTVEATIATDNAVTVFDWESGRIIDEVLMAEGMRHDKRQVPMLDSHMRFGIESVIGSARKMKREDGNVVATLAFSKRNELGDTAIELIREGHLTDVSVGYRVEESTTLASGQSKSIKGRTFTAGERTLRVVTRWSPREVSLVSIGADAASTVRSESKEPDMADQEKGKDTPTPAAPERDEGQRSDANPTPPAAPTTPAAPAAPQNTPTPNGERNGTLSLEDERKRVADIIALRSDKTPQAIVDQCIREAVSVAEAGRMFLEAERKEWAKPAPAPAGHSKRDATVDVLAFAVAERIGCNLIDGKTDEKRKAQEQLAEQAHAMRGIAWLDVCRESCRIDGIDAPLNKHELVRAAVSTASFTNAMAQAVNKRFMQAFELAGDSTVGWVQESDVSDFRTNRRIKKDRSARLKKHARGGTAKHETGGDKQETFKIARYSDQFVADEMDIIDDDMNVIMQQPQEMGEAAALLRPDLVYSILLANAALEQDNVALFHSTHANLMTTSSALSRATLATAIANLGKQRQNNKALNLRPGYLLVPQDLWSTADVLLKSAANVENATEGNLNQFAQFGIVPRYDDRLGVAGVTDPDTETAYVGTATNWFLIARGAPTIEVAYLAGTGRAPQIRSFTLDKGQWGMGWDIKHDIGAKALTYEGMLKATGAS